MDGCLGTWHWLAWGLTAKLEAVTWETPDRGPACTCIRENELITRQLGLASHGRSWQASAGTTGIIAVD